MSDPFNPEASSFALPFHTRPFDLLRDAVIPYPVRPLRPQTLAAADLLAAVGELALRGVRGVRDVTLAFWREHELPRRGLHGRRPQRSGGRPRRHPARPGRRRAAQRRHGAPARPRPGAPLAGRGTRAAGPRRALVRRPPRCAARGSAWP
ncbi:hypothetical protein ACU686_20425 [Yinghuangia aomiensis]